VFQSLQRLRHCRDCNHPKVINPSVSQTVDVHERETGRRGAQGSRETQGRRRSPENPKGQTLAEH